MIRYLACFLLFTLTLSSHASPQYNVLWITGESLQAKHLHCYGYLRLTSPNIDALAERGVRFNTCISSSAWTTESMVSNFLGVYSPAHKVITRDRAVPAEWLTPMEILAKRGYVIPRMTDYQQPEQIAHRDLGYTEATVNNVPPWDWIERHARVQADRPFFMWYHLYESHLPYEAHAEHQLFFKESMVSGRDAQWRIDLVRKTNILPRDSITFYPETDAEAVHALYDQEVHQIDAKLGRILAALDAAGLREKTLIVFSADHAEALLEHGFIGHPTTLLAGNLYDEVLHVPLILSLPGVLPKGTRVESQVSAVDVMPTLFELLGLEPQPSFQGKSLAPLWEGQKEGGRIAFSATANRGYLEPDPENVTHLFYSARTPQWKLILEDQPQLRRYTLYDLANDPGETKDVSTEHPRVLERMKRALHRWLRECHALEMPRE